MISPETYGIAYFISPHGYGHAARACGVMAALHKSIPQIRFELFTQVPEWFFRSSLSAEFGYHEFLTDIGLVQETPLKADVGQTLRRLDQFLPLPPGTIHALAALVRDKECRMIVCDISPLGIKVAEEAGIPSILVENFTWDWIYQEYVDEYAGFREHIRYLETCFNECDYHIQTEPVCLRRSVDLTSSPVSRPIKTAYHELREKLGVSDAAKVVMVTMGGIPDQYPFLQKLKDLQDVLFVIPGGDTETRTEDNVLFLPHRSDFFHPDLVYASDAVVGKVGYSTLAEVYQAGVAFGYVLRRHFPESAVLADFIDTRMHGLSIEADDFYQGGWTDILQDLLRFPRMKRQGTNGAAQIADFISGLIGNSF